MSGQSADETRWTAAADDHRAAVQTFLEQARAVPSDRWEMARTQDKWSAAQIAEHVRLTYATLRRELEGGTGFRQRVSGLRAFVYRVAFLRKMLRRRKFIEGAPATREVRPGSGPFDREATLAGLVAEAEAVVASLVMRRAARTTVVTHPFFGRLTPMQGLELCALHTRHHARQLQAAGDQNADAGRAASAPAGVGSAH